MDTTILLVEDNLGDARLVEEMIVEINYDLDGRFILKHVDSLNSAKLFFQNNVADIVLLDLGLPESNGTETIKKFIEFNTNIPIIAYTGINDVKLGEEILKLKANDYICKNDVSAPILAKTILINIKRDELQKELEDKDRILIAQSRSAAMGDMINMIAHQWKQPLAVLSMDVNNIKVDLELNEFDISNLEESLNCMEEQIIHQSTTIDDFRDFFKPNKEKTLILVDIPLDNTIELISKSLESHSITLSKKYQHIEPVKIYPNELMQVVINLLKNAKEALIEKEIENKEIYLDSCIKDGKVNIIIEDNAGGINNDIINKVFNPYFTTKEANNGTGIGLHISKTIIEKHFGGEIKVENGEKGARFTISFAPEY